MKWGGNVNKILMLTVSNIKKTIGHTISLFIMFLIAALLLNSGLLISINFNKFSMIPAMSLTPQTYIILCRLEYMMMS